MVMEEEEEEMVGLDGCILPAGQLQQGRQSEWRSDVATRHPQAAVTECAW